MRVLRNAEAAVLNMIKDHAESPPMAPDSILTTHSANCRLLDKPFCPNLDIQIETQGERHKTGCS